jgi:hypothetical protein
MRAADRGKLSLMHKHEVIQMTTEENQRIEKYSDLLDTKFRIPFTNIRFGFDFLIGLVPGLGDILSFTLSGGLLLMMIRKGASGKALAIMIVNIILDATFGSIPFFGDIFDLFFKANKRNLDLFQAHFQEGEHKGSAWPIIMTVVIIFLILFIGTGYLIYQLMKGIYHWVIS